MLPYHAYSTPGVYSITVNITNPFGSLVVDSFCSQVYVRAPLVTLTSTSTSDKMTNTTAAAAADNGCSLTAANVVLSVNGLSMSSVAPGQMLSLYRGFTNKFSVRLAACANETLRTRIESSLKTSWSARRLWSDSRNKVHNNKQTCTVKSRIMHRCCVQSLAITPGCIKLLYPKILSYYVILLKK